MQKILARRKQEQAPDPDIVADLEEKLSILKEKQAQSEPQIFDLQKELGTCKGNKQE